MENEAEALKLTLRDAHDTLREAVGNDPSAEASSALDDMREIVTWLGQLAKELPNVKLLNIKCISLRFNLTRGVLAPAPTIAETGRGLVAERPGLENTKTTE